MSRPITPQDALREAIDSVPFDRNQPTREYAAAILAADPTLAADLALAEKVRRVFWVDGPTGLYWQAARHAIEENIKVAKEAGE